MVGVELGVGGNEFPLSISIVVVIELGMIGTAWVLVGVLTKCFGGGLGRIKMTP